MLVKPRPVSKLETVWRAIVLGGFQDAVLQCRRLQLGALLPGAPLLEDQDQALRKVPCLASRRAFFVLRRVGGDFRVGQVMETARPLTVTSPG